MQEYKIEILIDKDGNIKAETKGMSGDTCIYELGKVLKNIEGKQSFSNKPEFYQEKKLEINQIIKY